MIIVGLGYSSSIDDIHSWLKITLRNKIGRNPQFVSICVASSPSAFLICNGTTHFVVKIELQKSSFAGTFCKTMITMKEQF